MLLETLPLIPLGLGGAVVGGAFTWGIPKARMHSSKRKQQLVLKENAAFAEELLVKSHAFRSKCHTNAMGTTPVDGKFTNFDFVAEYKRGASEQAQTNFNSHFAGEKGGKRIIEHKIRSRVQMIVRSMLKAFTRGQLLFYEQPFAREVARQLKEELLSFGLVLVNFELTVDNSENGSSINLQEVRAKSFEELLAVLPKKEDMVEYLENVEGDKESTEKDRARTSTNVESSKVLSIRLRTLEKSWMEYEVNHDLLLKYPLMSDASCEETAAFLLAMSKVKALHSAVADDESMLGEFAVALEAAEAAFIKAESNAKKVRHAFLTDGQRKKVENSRPLIAMYQDEEASPNERLNAFKQASRNLEGIIALPERPIMGLLEAGAK